MKVPKLFSDMTQTVKDSSGYNLLCVSTNNFWVKTNHETSGLFSDFRAMYEVLFLSNIYAYRYLPDKRLQLVRDNQEKEITNLQEIPETSNVYLLLEPTSQSAKVFGHWVGEALIFIPTVAKLLLALPNLKVILSGNQSFKIKILQYYRIPFVVADEQMTAFTNPDGSAENIFLYQLKVANVPNYFGIMPLIVSEDSSDWLSFFSELANKFYYFIDSGLPPNPFKNIDISYFPRHKEGNFAPTDRKIKDDDLRGYLLTLNNCVIAESQNLTWEQEIDILSRSKIIIVPDGSALMATLPARNSTIIVLGSLNSLTGIKIRPKQEMLFRLIEKTNRVYFINKSKSGDWLEELKPLLDYSIVVA